MCAVFIVLFQPRSSGRLVGNEELQRVMMLAFVYKMHFVQ